MPTLEHLVYCGIKNSRIPTRVHASGFGPPLYLIQPATFERIRFDSSDVSAKAGIASQKVAFGDCKEIADGFESLDPSDFLAVPDARPWFDIELVLDNVAEHARGELRESDPPYGRSNLEQPVVRTRINAICRKPSAKSGSLIYQHR